MNNNEKKTFRIGLVLLALAAAVSAPLAYAAAQPVVPVPTQDVPVVQHKETVSRPVLVETSSVLVLAPQVAPKKVARHVPVAAPKRAVDCSNAPRRETLDLATGGTVVYCHN